MNWPFTAPEDLSTWTSLSADGFAEPVVGCVYDGSKLDGGLPIGGLGTGYFTLEGTGRVGHCSIYNEIVPPREVYEDWLTLTLQDQELSLSAASITYWGHYPVADMRAEFTNVPVCLAIRAFSPFVVGDAEVSGAPLGLFEIRVENSGDSGLELDLSLTMPAPPEGSSADAVLLGDEPSAVVRDRLTQTVKISLRSGETRPFRFVFAWYAPNWRDSSLEAHVHRYGRSYEDADTIAEFGLSNFSRLLSRVLSWQAEIYRADLPAWLKDALIQSFYSMAKNTVWIAKTRQDEWWDESTGWFTHNESHAGCPITETMVCRMHGHFPILLFFPELEVTTLDAFRHFQIADGEIPFSYGMRTSMRDPRFHCQHPLNSGQYAQMVYRLYKRTGSRSLLERFYPSAKRAIRYLQLLDDDGDGLVNDQAHVTPSEHWPANQFYDIWPWWGTSAYVAGTWLATLSIGKAMAAEMDDQEFRSECESWLTRGLQAYEEKLWTGSYYRLWSDPGNMGESDICLGNQLMADWCLRIVGLDRVLPTENVQSALDAVQRLNMSATRHGLVNGVTPDGQPYDAGYTGGSNDHGRNVFIGENLCAAMTFAYNGHREVGLEIARRLYEAVSIVGASPWRQRCIVSSETGMPLWGEDYYSNMAFWALPAALKGEGIDGLVGPEGIAHRMIEAARDTSEKAR